MDLVESRTTRGTRHPWETARFEFFARVVADHVRLPPPVRVLDMGSGDAWFASQMVRVIEGATTDCCDLHYTPEIVATLSRENPELRFVREPGGPYDLVFLLDVAEHVEDDRSLLASLVAQMNPGAALVFSVPAYPALWSAHDEHLRHVRRYMPNEARALLEGAGLAIEIAGGVFGSLIFPRALSVVKERLMKPTGEVDTSWNGGAALTKAITSALAADGRVSLAAARAKKELPGLSYWAVARK